MPRQIISRQRLQTKTWRIEMKEEWRDVNGYEGMYQVSSHGRVRSLDRWVNHPNGQQLKRGLMIKGWLGGSRIKYPTVTLSDNGCETKHYVHKLVAKTFLGESTLPFVRHLDGNPLNNHVDNLEYCTHWRH